MSRFGRRPRAFRVALSSARATFKQSRNAFVAASTKRVLASCTVSPADVSKFTVQVSGGAKGLLNTTV